MNASTLLVAVVVAAVFTAIIARGVHSRRRGRGCSACGGDCSPCGGDCSACGRRRGAE